ncbi:MAG TPA: TIGR00289 family protein [Candidatus Aenigmarchaeota archaeon]|nr:TIGR00289 family protein [Candidatus Aenigmarchaeota archaeon]
MKLGILFSGGKDSCLALYRAMQKEEVVCLLTVISKNPESFMFHTPNIHLTEKQAEAIGLPLVSVVTEGEKEKELKELKEVMERGKEEFGIEGVVTGTIESVYQAARIQKICDSLKLWCFNPLWQKNQEEILKELVENGFEVLITGVFAEPFGREWLGKRIDKEVVKKLVEIEGINPAGEGGEIETTVLDAPFFRKRIKVKGREIKFENNSGIMEIKKVELVEK